MELNDQDRLTQLCEEAAKERDFTRLIELMREINDVLEKRRSRFNSSSENSDGQSKGNATSG